MKITNKRRRFFSSAAIGLIMVLGTSLGCGGKHHSLNGVPARTYERTKKSDEISQLNQQLFASTDLNVDPGDYLLGPGDVLQVSVFEAKELQTKVRVSSRGFVTLSLLGQVEVEGLSAREAEEKIEGLYRNGYIKDPHVSIFVEEHFSQRVTIVGQVKNPGTYDYLSKQRLLDILALAGGLADNAGPTAQIRRVGSEQQMLIVDLVKLIKEGNTELNIEINGGDIIFVPEAGVFFVDGAVRRPGSYPIKQKMVIREALLAAGGLAPYAKKDTLFLLRCDGNRHRETIELDLKQQEDQELEIIDRDIIIAKDSALGKLIHGVGVNLGIPFAGIGYRDPER